MNNPIILTPHDFSPAPYMKDMVKMIMENEKVVVIQKNPSCGPSINVMQDMLYPKYSLSSDEIERRVKKETLPDYVKESLKRCLL